VVEDPPAGFWTLDQLYPSPPFATYSAPGRKYLLYRTQAALKERGLYTSSVDGKEGKSTHNAIQLFQAKAGLRPTGLLDLPTLSALQLVAEPDYMDWSTPASIPTPPGGVRRPAGGARYNRSAPKEDPNLLERTSDRLRNLFNR
jgi:peptidoglycan hydrolase-like protein with peptidoglycan-binding domain